MGKGITPEDMRVIAKARGVKGTSRKTFQQCLDALLDLGGLLEDSAGTGSTQPQ